LLSQNCSFGKASIEKKKEGRGLNTAQEFVALGAQYLKNRLTGGCEPSIRFTLQTPKACPLIEGPRLVEHVRQFFDEAAYRLRDGLR
jgi:hypothetical protein